MLIIRTTLNSPNPTVVKGLKPNDVLVVEAQGITGPVIAKTVAGGTAGSVTDRRLLDLLKCIADGFDYVAIVQSVTGGKIDVEIRPKSS